MNLTALYYITMLPGLRVAYSLISNRRTRLEAYNANYSCAYDKSKMIYDDIQVYIKEIKDGKSKSG